MKIRSSAPSQFFRVFPAADRPLAVAWWGLLVARAVLPSLFAIGTGLLVAAVSDDDPLAGPLVLVAVCFVLLQLLPQLHTAVSMNLGSKVAAHLNDRLATACVDPPGIGHLEDPELTSDLNTARDFDRGMSGPPMYLNVDFTSASLTTMVSGLVAAAVLARYSWWGAILLVLAWGSTHWLLKESGVWRDRNTAAVKLSRRHAAYAYDLAVTPGPAKEIRLFGLPDWTVDRFAERRRELFRLEYAATRLRERSVLGALTIVLGANVAFYWWLGDQAASGDLALGKAVMIATLAMGTQAIAFGGLNWVMDGAAAPVVAVNTLTPRVGPAGALRPPSALASTFASATAPSDRAGIHLRFEALHFAYPRTDREIYSGLDLEVRAGESLAIVGSNGAGKTTLAKLLCRFYDPTGGRITADGVDLVDLEVDAWRRRITAVFQDVMRLDRSLRDNVDPGHRATDDEVRAALHDAGAEGLASLDQPLAKGYEGGTDLSGGQWQRVALARALCAVRRSDDTAGLVLLDEPTANLDVRGEAVIFRQLLEATEGATRILISHRFSTVRMADRIAVLEAGRVRELGTHDELMVLGGRYQRMFDLQASRFDASADEEGFEYETL